jgi:hypothetical protein
MGELADTASGAGRAPLSVLGIPVKVGSLGHSSLFGLVLPCAADGGPQSGSRWSARSAARTNDLEADCGPPHTLVGQGRGKDGVVQVIYYLP